MYVFQIFVPHTIEHFFSQLVRNIMVTDYFFVYSYFFQWIKKTIKNFWDMEIIGNIRKMYFFFLKWEIFSNFVTFYNIWTLLNGKISSDLRGMYVMQAWICARCTIFQNWKQPFALLLSSVEKTWHTEIGKPWSHPLGSCSSWIS